MKFLLNREEPQPQEATMRSLPSPKADKRKSKESCTVICHAPLIPRDYTYCARGGPGENVVHPQGTCTAELNDDEAGTKSGNIPEVQVHQ